MTAVEEPVSPGTASSFETCLRQCVVCGIGASNTSDSDRVTYIHRNPLTNIPAEARAEALETLRAALNARNRAKKESYFGFSTSEDAVTWVVFEYLWRFELLVPALRQLGLPASDSAGSAPEMLLWGVPRGGSGRATALRERLVSECLALEERPNALSEPDVIIDLGDRGIAFIEVKYLSGNDCQPSTYANWSKYNAGGRPAWRFEEVKATGCYELARYWCLLDRVAAGRKGWLVNLGLPGLFDGPEGARLDRFVAALGPSESLEFRKATWAGLLTPVLPQAEGWFSRFCREERTLGLR